MVLVSDVKLARGQQLPKHTWLGLSPQVGLAQLFKAGDSLSQEVGLSITLENQKLVFLGKPQLMSTLPHQVVHGEFLTWWDCS